MNNLPPQLEKSANGDLQNESLANVIEWFLSFDERTAIMRHPYVEAVYQWRQQDAKVNGAETLEAIAPFDRAEDRFAIGVFQALAENKSESALQAWMRELLQAVQEAKELNAQISTDFKLVKKPDVSPIDQANMLPTNGEKRLYLTAYWLESLCTAELRVLGWIYQELYGKPFAA